METHFGVTEGSLSPKKAAEGGRASNDLESDDDGGSPHEGEVVEEVVGEDSSAQ